MASKKTVRTKSVTRKAKAKKRSFVDCLTQRNEALSCYLAGSTGGPGA
jgi:hypothetical protein